MFEVESVVGQGTKFIITLPITHEQDAFSEDEEVLSNLRQDNGV